MRSHSELSSIPKKPADITLVDLMSDVWRAKILMLVFAIISTGFALTFVTIANPYVRAEMIIAPATPIGNHPQATPDFEGIIQLQTGVMTGSAAFTRFEALYNGVSVAMMLLQDERVLKGLAQEKTFRFSVPQTEWTADELAIYLKRRLKLEPVSATQLRKLVYLHPDPDFAQHLIGRVHKITDEMIRVSILEEVNGRIEYLNASLARTQNAEHRRALTELLMEQERLKMLVSLDQPYAASVVEPPSAAARVVWPDVYLIFGGFILAGLMLGYVVHGFRKR